MFSINEYVRPTNLGRKLKWSKNKNKTKTINLNKIQQSTTINFKVIMKNLLKFMFVQYYYFSVIKFGIELTIIFILFRYLKCNSG